MEAKPSLFSIRGIISIALYMTAGPTLVLMNNYVLNDLSFQYPIMLSSLGIFTSSLIIHALVLSKYITIRNEIKNIVTFKFLITRIGILSLLQALTLNFGNLVYTHLSVSLIQMLKAFTPVITMILTFMTGQLEPNRQLVYAIGLLSVGTMITSANVSDADASTIGFVIMFAAEGCEALKLVLAQKLVQGIKVERVKENVSDDIEETGDDEEKQQLVKHEDLIDSIERSLEKTKETKIEMVNLKFSVWESLYYYAPMTFVCQCVLSLPLEWKAFNQNWDTNMVLIKENWLKFVICGCLGFSVNMAGWLVTQIASGLYLKALGTFRNICLVAVSVVLFAEIVTFKQSIGYGVSLIGFIYYNYLKVQASKK